VLALLSDKAIILLACVKGIAMSTIIVLIADATFVQGLITAIASAVVSGTFLLISIHTSSKLTNKKVEESKDEIIKQNQESSNNG
jgi:uncharacterized membrane-anchored protein